MNASDALEAIARIKQTHPENIAIQCFDFDYFAGLDAQRQRRLLRCVESGIENPESEMGCYANEPSDYEDFRPFFSKILARYHHVSEDSRHTNNWSLSSVEGAPQDGVLDIAKLGLPPLSIRVRIGRNLADLSLPSTMSKGKRVELENRMIKMFDRLTAVPSFSGTYYSLTPGNPNEVSRAEYNQLIADHVMFKNMEEDSYLAAAGIASDWPHGRGCYISGDRALIIWVGEEDHLRIMCMARTTDLTAVFNRLKTAHNTIEALHSFTFAKSDDYGYVTSCPTNLGTGMRASIHIPLPNLTVDGLDARIKEIARKNGLGVRGVGGEHTPIGEDGTVDISPKARFCITEAEIISKLYTSVAFLKVEEDKAGGRSHENL